jgi:hypothetical protein
VPSGKFPYRNGFLKIGKKGVSRLKLKPEKGGSGFSLSLIFDYLKIKQAM